MRLVDSCKRISESKCGSHMLNFELIFSHIIHNNNTLKGGKLRNDKHRYVSVLKPL